ncbi:hypothetical protein NDU88_000863 [Pleurodeles waltl]|uniref:Uncharacterized protein n=1 Tax=Pleurodeles waltl TaxID=8319 RepID=A0AAV7L9M6_PLEWA|nr:hypothetical protein NDU88_000863 [Pleurodeles waltl]
MQRTWGAGPTEEVLEELGGGLSCDGGSNPGGKKAGTGSGVAQGGPRRKEDTPTFRREVRQGREKWPLGPWARWDPHNTPQERHRDLGTAGLPDGLHRSLSETAEERELHHIASPEETHLRPADHHRLQSRTFPIQHVSSQENKVAGVALLVLLSFREKVADKVVEIPGRLIAFRVHIGDSQVIMASIHVPNGKQERFIRRALGEVMNA